MISMNRPYLYTGVGLSRVIRKSGSGDARSPLLVATRETMPRTVTPAVQLRRRVSEDVSDE